MFEKFFPKEYIESVYKHDFSIYANYGFRVILFDIDNTLTLHDEKATDISKFFIQCLKNMGYQIGVVSNNGIERVSTFAMDTNCDVFIDNAGKPAPDGIWRAAAMLQTNVNQIIFVGDQIFTDVVAGNNAGAYTILTKPLGKEKYFHIKLKRILETPFKNKIEDMKKKGLV